MGASVVFLEGFCDFEMDFCGWVNSPPPESGTDWEWFSGESEGQMVPTRDHTTNSALGTQPYYLFFTKILLLKTKVILKSVGQRQSGNKVKYTYFSSLISLLQ